MIQTNNNTLTYRVLQISDIRSNISRELQHTEA